MSDRISPLRRPDRDSLQDPTGESLLDRGARPWLAWVPPSPVLVLGNSQDPELELDVPAVQRDRIPVHRRIGGGGAVLLSPGCVCLALRFRKKPSLSIHDYFDLGASVIVEMARDRLAIPLYRRGISDLAVAIPGGDRKVAGSSLYMPRDFVLYLVSLLVSPDLEMMGKYLGHPSKEPGYRSGRPHSLFLSGLAELTKRKAAPVQVREWLETLIPERLGPSLDWPEAGSG
jgi:lipoate-protein ligase A